MAMVFPQQFGPYTLHQLVGRGGMAEIYRATMPGIGSFEKVLAIKKILPHLVENEEYITMLTDEARLVVGLNHANIAQVYDLGRIDDTYYIAMEYVHGVDISTIIKDAQRKQRPIPYEHVAYMMSGLCMGLHVAHHATGKHGEALNIIHRDISPHNVLISFAGDVKVIDFGVAKASSKEGQTQVGVIKGKLLYMAPEQAMAKDIDGRADLFAAGLVMYKMLTWTLPFQGDNEFQIYNNILTKEIVPPRQLNPAIPEELNQICMTLLSRDVEQRYQDGYSAKKDLDRALHRIAPGYTPSRLSRFIEDNFLEMVQERLRRQNSQASNAQAEAKSPRIREPVHAAAATGAQANFGATQAPPQTAAPQRTNTPGFGPTPTPGANMPGTPSGFHTPAPQTPAQGFFPANQGQATQGGQRTQSPQHFATGAFDAPTFPPAEAALPPAQKKKGLPLVFIAVIVLGVLFVAMGTYVFLSDSQPDTPPEQAPATTQPDETATPTAAPDTSDPGVAIAAPEDMGGSNTPDLAAESGPTIFQFDSEPAEAFCYLGEERLAKTPLNIEIAPEDFPATVTCKLEGFKDVTLELEQGSELSRRIVFEKLPEKTPEKRDTPPASPSSTRNTKPTKSPTKQDPTPSREADDKKPPKSGSQIDLFDSGQKKTPKTPKTDKKDPGKDTPDNLDQVLEGW